MGEFVVITGLSGAGRSQAAAHLEDLGWFVIDNVPPALIPKLAELVNDPSATHDHIAIVVRSGDYDEDVRPSIDALRATGRSVRVLFLDASTDVLVRRYESTRRRHPIAAPSLAAAIEQERTMLESLKGEADVVLDTSTFNVHELRAWIVELFAGGGEPGLQVSIVSFGYKHGLPLDVDLVFDCRFLPNPHWVEALRPHTGVDDDVRDYVLAQPEAREFLERLFALLLPAYVKEGKSYLSIGVGCTGGHHRSVVLAEELARILERLGFPARVHHRDLERG